MRLVVACVLLNLFVVSAASADEAVSTKVEADLKILLAVGPQGAGSEAARAARLRLATGHGVEILPQLLQAMDTNNFVAANWVRSVYEEIVARELAKQKPEFPVTFIRAYVQEAKHQGRARRLALTLLDRIEPEFGSKLIPTFLDDPEFRDDAVKAVLAEGDTARDAGRKEEARGKYLAAFEHARDSQQVTDAADRLVSVGHTVSIVEHMGFVVDWYLVGPFDAPEKTGYDLKLPPETNVDLKGTYPGQAGTPIGWKRHHANDRMGQLDLIQAIAAVKEAVCYAYTDVESAAEQKVQLRCSADDNLSVWLNGEKVFGRPQWLNGTRLDRFTTPVTLRAGKNTILVKVCQGPQHSDPSVGNAWSMQLRFCTEDGAGVALKSLLPAMDTPAAGK